MGSRDPGCRDFQAFWCLHLHYNNAISVYTRNGGPVQWLVQDLHQKLLKTAERLHQSRCSRALSVRNGMSVAAQLLPTSSIHSLDVVWKATQTAVTALRDGFSEYAPFITLFKLMTR